MVAVLDRPRTRAVRVNRLRRYTADEVIDFPNDDRIWELVDGQMVEKHGTNRTVSVAFQMAVALGTYAGVHGGVVIPPEGFVRLFGSPNSSSGLTPASSSPAACPETTSATATSTFRRT